MMKSSYCSGSYQCKVGINPVRDICWNPKLCPVCSGAFYTLTPRQQKEALAHMKHDPTKMNYKPCPLSPEEIKVIKEKYRRKSKPIKIPYKYYDIFISKKDIAKAEKKENELHSKAILINLPEEKVMEIEKEKQSKAASILLSLKEK